jgi:hypothetical protein
MGRRDKQLDAQDVRGMILALTDLVQALKHATGAASGLIYDSGNPEVFFVIRDALELANEGVMGVAAATGMLPKARVLYT